MKQIPIVDAHVHLWDTQKIRYPWLKDLPLLNRNFLLNDYYEATKALIIEKMIFMQCECDPSMYMDEVNWVTQLAEVEPKLQGIISFAPLEKGEAVRPELNQLKQNHLVKGIRRIIQFEEDLEFCLHSKFIEGVRLMPEYGFTFDICIDYRHTKNTIKFVEQLPNVKFMLDHIGKPDIRNNQLDPWREEIRTLASFPNVYCKISSLSTEADHHNWTIEGLKPYVNHIFDIFGFERTVFSGDWPVSLQAASYETCVETVLKLTDGATNEQLNLLFRQNALEFYNI
jgi:L-fuconolactonase